ncbi:MAG TPA: hypothetical protein VK897_18055 [Anaerolineales bacterium]|nr:hypothetical protein [Anaerolineales bacterium]
MNRKYQIAFLMILVGAAFSTLAFVIWPTIRYRSHKTVETVTLSSPDQVVQNFYDWYISYEGHPLVDQAYRSSEYLSPEFISYLDDFTGSGEWNYDPILCAQEIPTEVTALPVQISEQKALVEVTTSFMDHSLTVELTRVDGDWRIDKVICN